MPKIQAIWTGKIYGQVNIGLAVCVCRKVQNSQDFDYKLYRIEIICRDAGQINLPIGIL
jgi:hypothetical protein